MPLNETQIKPFPFYGYAPGNYQNTCCQCNKDMIVDKLCFICLPCAIKVSIADLISEREKAKPLIEALDWCISIIKNSHEYKNVQNGAITDQLPFAIEALDTYNKNK